MNSPYDFGQSSTDDNDLEVASIGTAGFNVHDESSANWIVRKIAEARRYGLRVKAWAELETRRAERESEFFFKRYAVELEAWLRGRLNELGGKRKSINLPAGTVGIRAEQSRLTIIDHASLTEWCTRNLNEAVRVRIESSGSEGVALRKFAERSCPDARLSVEISKVAVNGYFHATGHIPAGTELVEAYDQLIIK